MLPPFGDWILEEARRQQQAGVFVDSKVVDTGWGPLPTTAYKAMSAFYNQFQAIAAKRAMKTSNSGIAATFGQLCRAGAHDTNLVYANVEYIGHIEEILELNYRRHCIVVLVCDFVKANYNGDHATIKKGKWEFTLANNERRLDYDSFAFPRQCRQIYYSKALDAPGWRVVLQKDVHGKRIILGVEDDEDSHIFDIGEDEQFLGLRPERHVGEEAASAVSTGHNVMLKKHLVPGRHRSAGVSNSRRGRGGQNVGASATNRTRNMAEDRRGGRAVGQTSECRQRNQCAMDRTPGSSTGDNEEEGHSLVRTGRGRPGSRQIRRRENISEIGLEGGSSKHVDMVKNENVEDEDVDFLGSTATESSDSVSSVTSCDEFDFS